MAAIAAFGEYDQQGLDAQYDTRRQVPGVTAYRTRWVAESAAVRQRRATCVLDISYGPAAMQKLDVFPAEQSAVPVQIFFHGGYWSSSDKLYYSFIADAFASRGVLAIVVNYALCPSVDMNQLIEQCREAVVWSFRNAANFGGDASRLFISGHSAGGHIVAMLAATHWTRYSGMPADVVKGVTAISGLFDLEPIMRSSMNSSIQLTPEIVRDNSPCRLSPPRVAMPMILAAGSLESPEFRRQSAEYADLLTAAGFECEFQEVSGHHHYSILDAFCNSNHRLGTAVLRQLGAA